MACYAQCALIYFQRMYGNSDAHGSESNRDKASSAITLHQAYAGDYCVLGWLGKDRCPSFSPAKSPLPAAEKGRSHASACLASQASVSLVELRTFGTLSAQST